MKFITARFAAFCFCIATLTLLVLAGCVRQSSLSSHVLPQTIAAAVFVSDTECQSCHAKVFQTHTHSRHAITLHSMTSQELAALAPPVGPVPQTPYEIRKQGDQYFFGLKNDPKQQNRMDLALGSGKLAMTYVSLHPDKTLTELRMSYYPSKKRWYITPGQEIIPNLDLGFAHEQKMARNCLGCHTTTVPNDNLMPEKRFFGVGCQSCHGPASAHVAAMKAGKYADIKLERIASWQATRINEMCGKCHRSPSDVGTSGNDITMTQRFQPYGLMQSPCFQNSGDKLSCVTCHDPHTKVSQSEHEYDTACLRCHASPVSSARPVGSTALALTGSKSGSPTLQTAAIMQAKVCPINASEKCVACHMPKRKVFPASQLPISMADHLIWAYRKKPSSPAAGHAATPSKDSARITVISQSTATLNTPPGP